MKFAYKASKLKESTGSTSALVTRAWYFVGMMRRERCLFIKFSCRSGIFCRGVNSKIN